MEQLGLAVAWPSPQPAPMSPLGVSLPAAGVGDPTEPNQAWSTDITYIRLAQGFGYLVAIIGLVLHIARCSLGGAAIRWTREFCVDCFQEAVRRFGVRGDLRHQ